MSIEIMEKDSSTLLREILKSKKVSQKDLADAVGISEPLMSWWCAHSTAAAAHLGSILKFIDMDGKELIRLIRKHLP